MSSNPRRFRGKRIEIEVQNPDQLLELPVADMASGVYRLRYVDDQTSFSRSFVKQ